MRRRRPRNLPIIQWFVIVMLWIFMGVYIFPSLIKVLSNWRSEARKARSIKEENRKIEIKTKEMEEYIKYLQNPKGQEEEARKQGWVKQGEILIEVKGKLPHPPEKNKKNFFYNLLEWLEKRRK